MQEKFLKSNLWFINFIDIFLKLC